MFLIRSISYEIDCFDVLSFLLAVKHLVTNANRQQQPTARDTLHNSEAHATKGA